MKREKEQKVSYSLYLSKGDIERIEELAYERCLPPRIMARALLLDGLRKESVITGRV